VTDDDRRARLDLTERVGRALAELGLDRHVAQARRYYAALRAGREPAKDGWTHEMIVEWARLLRLPGHDVYPVHPRMHRCCERPKTFTSATFPGGSRHHCEACGATWLELD
jgi:hypothetical protein